MSHSDRSVDFGSSSSAAGCWPRTSAAVLKGCGRWSQLVFPAYLQHVGIVAALRVNDRWTGAGDAEELQRLTKWQRQGETTCSSRYRAGLCGEHSAMLSWEGLQSSQTFSENRQMPVELLLHSVIANAVNDIIVVRGTRWRLGSYCIFHILMIVLTFVRTENHSNFTGQMLFLIPV